MSRRGEAGHTPTPLHQWQGVGAAQLPQSHQGIQNRCLYRRVTAVGSRPNSCCLHRAIRAPLGTRPGSALALLGGFLPCHDSAVSVWGTHCVVLYRLPIVLHDSHRSSAMMWAGAQ